MRFPLLWLCLLLPLFVAVAPQVRAEAPVDPFAKWEKEIAAFEQKDRQSPPPKGGIVFVGSSSIRKWTTLAEDFPHRVVINRGFGGSQLIDSVHFADRIVIPYEPRMIVLYAGTNDIHAGKSPEQVFADFQSFVEKIHAKLPKTEIAYISNAGNPARWADVEKVKTANSLIEKYIEGKPGLKFIDVFPRMLGTDGLPRPEIFGPDRLHMNAEGYKLWTEIVGPYLPSPDK
ncbi:lipolytic protein G-D-S-L family [Chthoniobacter flavus Ellin428]|uniref:Lipolytic protein G-D-S-L family n=1 Tax=Chthoniobacter flavus Ellin428 TaxID=497964 RepID=B4D567_9BACT|nr:SGNH/GDSL hydrolase family protein [Chthoniobacter flavus]EDY18272.1 lipolytic protein G-D-S-L family [Chthoniobacter flavus Ellin428]TCO91301.1 lysophospholipase L1-like esterase [Chthoniobacter flavus]